MSKTIRLGFLNDETHKYMTERDNLYFVRRVLEEKEKGNLIGNIRISDKSIDYHVRETETTIDIIRLWSMWKTNRQFRVLHLGKMLSM